MALTHAIQVRPGKFGFAGLMLAVSFAAAVATTALGSARPAAAQSYGYPTMPAYTMPMSMGYSSMMAPGYAMMASAYAPSMMGYGSYTASAAMPSAGVGISWEYCTIPGGGAIWIPWGSPTNGLLC